MLKLRPKKEKPAEAGSAELAQTVRYQAIINRCFEGLPTTPPSVEEQILVIVLSATKAAANEATGSSAHDAETKTAMLALAFAGSMRLVDLAFEKPKKAIRAIDAVKQQVAHNVSLHLLDDVSLTPKPETEDLIQAGSGLYLRMAQRGQLSRLTEAWDTFFNEPGVLSQERLAKALQLSLGFQGKKVA
jgi:hypothetical protein